MQTPCEKIIDFEKKGNVVRFYLGTADNYWGDDWNDRPYEHNAGTVYDEYVTRTIDAVFPFDASVLEPANDYAWDGNSPYSKEDMQKRFAPCIVVVPSEITAETYDTYSFSKYSGSSNQVVRFFFGDPVDRILTCKLATVISDCKKETQK